MATLYTINSTTMTSLANAVRNLRNVSDSFTPSQIISNIYPITYVSAEEYKRSTLTSYYNNSVMFIEYAAFSSCSYLNVVSVPNCEYIGECVFYRCSSLQTIYAPICKYIDSSAFYECYSLNKIIFSYCSVIGSTAFKSCRSLTTASFSKCTYIFGNAFDGCTTLSSLYLNQVTSVTTLANSNAFNATPLSAGGTGKIYVPSSLLASFKAATNWSLISARLVSM